MDVLAAAETDDVDVEYLDDTACWLVVCSPDPLRLETTLASDVAISRVLAVEVPEDVVAVAAAVDVNEDEGAGVEASVEVTPLVAVNVTCVAVDKPRVVACVETR